MKLEITYTEPYKPLRFPWPKLMPYYGCGGKGLYFGWRKLRITFELAQKGKHQ